MPLLALRLNQHDPCSPVEICFGTRPSQAAKSRPLENASPLPIAATIACLHEQNAQVAITSLRYLAEDGAVPWIEAAKKRLHRNVLAIALANKLARIAWSVLASGRSFEARHMASAA
jgi:hypothetical protein